MERLWWKEHDYREMPSSKDNSDYVTRKYSFQKSLSEFFHRLHVAISLEYKKEGNKTS